MSCYYCTSEDVVCRDCGRDNGDHIAQQDALIKDLRTTIEMIHDYAKDGTKHCDLDYYLLIAQLCEESGDK